MDIEAWGSHLVPADGWHAGDYLIAARCVRRCHYIRWWCSLDAARDPGGLLDYVWSHLQHELARVHAEN